MKKSLTFFLLATSVACFGQTKDFLKDVSSINFYGVDYSSVKVFGASETPAEFKAAFAKINQLFISEAKKYDVGKALKTEVSAISLDAVNKVNAEIEPSRLMTANTSFTLNKEEVERAVEALPIQQEPGIGLVIIAEFLDKAKAYGSYQAVFFHTETKEIISNYALGGKARGFGLRNYWAGSICKAIKHL